MKLAEHIPLKQGLRRHLLSYTDFFCVLAEHIPLKQGLRHAQQQLDQQYYYSCCDLAKAYSIKTRIKTLVRTWFFGWNASQSIFH
jgi:hypothetical protein